MFERTLCGAAIAALLLMPAPALGAPSPADLARLGQELTPIGAERAGNKEGTIPAWTGGQCTPPPGYKPLDGQHGFPYVDAYAADQPILRISAANLAEHAARLDDAQQAMLKADPSYRIDVYPTRRSACHPPWVYDNTRQRAGSPKLVGAAPGLDGAHAQVPFPIPETGQQVMWNFLTAYRPVHYQGELDGWLVDANGRSSLITRQIFRYRFPYWDNTTTAADELSSMQGEVYAPAAIAGRMDLRTQWLRMDLKEPRAWAYTPGQRRVRLAPEFNYDTVVAQYSGLVVFDEFNGFDGRMDRFDFRLAGKKELYIPYNTLRFQQAPADQVMEKGHVNPDLLRWELHRVWVVEATRKPGARHVYSKKVFYIDEDSWLIASYNSYDDAGRLYRSMLFPLYQQYDIPMPSTQCVIGRDHLRGGWYVGGRPLPGTSGWRQMDRLPEAYFSPDGMAAMGVR